MQYCSQHEISPEDASAPTKSWEKYKHTVVGDKPFIDFLIYEILVLFIMPVSGKLGTWLRQSSYNLLLGKLGKNTEIEKDVTLRKPRQIKIGSQVKIATGCSFDVKSSKGLISLEDNVTVGEKSTFNCISGKLIVKKHSSLGKHVRLGSLQGLTVGEQCVIGDSVYISGAAHSFKDLQLPIIKQALTCGGPTLIGDHVQIGKHTTITDGIHIGSHVAIEPGSFVNINIPDYSNVAGVPARVLPNGRKESADE